MNKKYELTSETRNGLFRIRALRDIPKHGIKKGDLGGWVASEKNLSQEGECWVGNNTSVRGNARVFQDALVHASDTGLIQTYVVIRENAEVYGEAEILGTGGLLALTDNAVVCGRVRIQGRGMLDSTLVVE